MASGGEGSVEVAFGDVRYVHLPLGRVIGRAVEPPSVEILGIRWAFGDIRKGWRRKAVYNARRKRRTQTC